VILAVTHDELYAHGHHKPSGPVGKGMAIEAKAVARREETVMTPHARARRGVNQGGVNKMLPKMSHYANADYVHDGDTINVQGRDRSRCRQSKVKKEGNAPVLVPSMTTGITKTTLL